MYGGIPILGELDYVHVIQNTNAKDNPSTWLLYSVIIDFIYCYFNCWLYLVEFATSRMISLKSVITVWVHLLRYWSPFGLWQSFDATSSNNNWSKNIVLKQRSVMIRGHEDVVTSTSSQIENKGQQYDNEIKSIKPGRQEQLSMF